MLSPIPSPGARPQEDTTWSNEPTMDSQLKKPARTPDLPKIRSPTNMKSPTSMKSPTEPRSADNAGPINFDVPDFLESDLGRYSKFKNVRMAEEYSIYEPKMFEEKNSSFVSNSISQVTGDQTNLAVPQEKETEQPQKEYGKGYTYSILMTIFSVEFGKFFKQHHYLTS